MNLRQILIQAVVGATLFSFAAQARYVFVLPPSSASTPTLTGYTDQLQPMGSVSIPSGASQAFTNATGTKAIVVAQNATSPVSFVTLSGTQFSGSARSISLYGDSPLTAAMTPDGQRLVVITTSNPGKVYVIDVAGEQVIGTISLEATPSEFVITHDSAYAMVLSNATVTYVNLSTMTIESTVALTGVAAGSTHISLAPSGFAYVTSWYLLIELSPTPSTAERARSSMALQPGKLTFSPEGQYALAPNLLTLNYSALDFDLGLSARTSSTAAGKYLTAAAVKSAAGITQSLDLLQPVSSSVALAWSSSLGKMFALTYPTLASSAINLGASGSPDNVTSLALSNELPSTKYLYYLTNGVLYQHDLVLNNAVNNVTVGGSSVVFAGKPSTSAVSTILAYNGGQTVGPSTAATPYYVRALDANGQPVYGAAVSFTPDATGVTLSDASLTTNAEGYAWVTATSRSTNGTFTVTANVGGVTTQITSTVTGASESGGGSGSGGSGGGTGTSASISKIAGDGQMVLLYSNGNTLKVKVLKADGTADAGKTVTWSESSGYIIVESSSVTDENGVASAVFFASGGVSIGTGFAQYSIVATADNVGSTTFTLTVYPFATMPGVVSAEPTALILTPTLEYRDLTLKLGTVYTAAITATVVTTGGNYDSPGLPIPGVGLTIESANSDATTGPVIACSGITPLSDSTGLISCDLVATGKTGQTAFSVNIGGGKLYTGFTANVEAGDPIAPVIYSGNNQTGKAGANLALPLVAKITDTSGNILVGTAVTWEVVTPNSATLYTTSSTSNSSGMVSTYVKLGSLIGTYTVKVTANGKSTVFSFTVQSVASALSKSSGDSQTAALSTAFTLPLVVQAQTSAGTAAAGVPITWAVASGAATLSATSSTTASDGKASVTVTAGATAGTITVTATASGLAAVTFTLTAAVPGPVLTTSSFKSFTSGESGLTPGGLVTISGTNLTSGISGTTYGTSMLGQWVYALNNVTVELVSGGVSYWAPIYSITNDSTGQAVVIQVPYEVATGTVTAKVTGTNSVTTTVTGVQVKPYMPGILETTISSRTVALASRADGSRVTTANPAKLGEQVRIYLTGLGQTTPAAATNTYASADQLVQAKIIVGLDNRGYDVTKASLVQNSIGIYEVIFTMPNDVTTGSYRPIVILLQDTAGNSYYSNASVIAISN